MREKSHKGRRHKGCGICKYYKRLGNGAERRPPTERRYHQHDRFLSIEPPERPERPSGPVLGMHALD